MKQQSKRKMISIDAGQNEKRQLRQNAKAACRICPLWEVTGDWGLVTGN